PTVIRYIELNPVRAAMVARPEDYRWSSVHPHLGQACGPLLTLHPLHLSLGAGSMQRAEAYGAWLLPGIGEDELANVRRHVAQERALGEPRFQRMVERALNRPATCRPAGRPSKQGDKRAVTASVPFSRDSAVVRKAYSTHPSCPAVRGYPASFAG